MDINAMNEIDPALAQKLAEKQDFLAEVMNSLRSSLQNELNTQYEKVKNDQELFFPIIVTAFNVTLQEFVSTYVALSGTQGLKGVEEAYETIYTMMDEVLKMYKIQLATNVPTSSIIQ